MSEVTRDEALNAAARWLRACEGLGQLLPPDEVSSRLCANAEVANAWTKIAFIAGREEDEHGTR